MREDTRHDHGAILPAGGREAGARQTWALSYIPELDGIRCFAVLAVVALHARVPFAKGGFLGVDIFFVLSGFLITSVLLKEHQATGSISLPRFYVRRALRLVPALLLVCAASLAYGLLAPGAEQARETLRGVVPTLFYVTNWLEVFRRVDLGGLSHTWSLAIEEQFYILVAPGMAIILAWRLRRARLAAWLLVGAGAVSVYRALLWDGPDSAFPLYRRLDTRADALLIGCALAALCAAGFLPRTPMQRRVLKCASLVSIAILLAGVNRLQYDDPALYRHGGLTLIAVCAAVVIYQVVTSPLPALNGALRTRPAVLVGRMSYGIYLWHNLLLTFFGPIRGLEIAWRVLLTFAIAALSFFCVEQPFLRLKDRFGGIRKPPITELPDPGNEEEEPSEAPPARQSTTGVV